MTEPIPPTVDAAQESGVEASPSGNITEAPTEMPRAAETAAILNDPSAGDAADKIEGLAANKIPPPLDASDDTSLSTQPTQENANPKVAEAPPAEQAEQRKQEALVQGKAAFTEITDTLGIHIRPGETPDALVNRINKMIDDPNLHWKADDPRLKGAIDHADAQRKADAIEAPQTAAETQRVQQLEQKIQQLEQKIQSGNAETGKLTETVNRQTKVIEGMKQQVQDVLTLSQQVVEAMQVEDAEKRKKMLVAIAKSLAFLVAAMVKDAIITTDPLGEVAAAGQQH